MKKKRVLCLAVMMCLSMLFSGLITTTYAAEENTTDFAGGNGTEENPYKVSNMYHLNNVRNYLDAYFIQTNDIDLTAATAEGGVFYFNGQGWLPIGDNETNFTGTYNGGGCTIIGVKSKRGGLFGNNNGTIKNLGMIDGNVRSGGIATRNDKMINNCYNTSNVSVSSSGGIAGSNSGTISNCYNTGNILGYLSGGIAGDNNGTISSCYNAGNIPSISSRSSSGGIVGANYSNGTTSNCYTLSELYYNDIGTKLTIEEMKISSNFNGFDFENLWEFNSTTSYQFPILKTVKHVERAENTINFDGGNGTIYNPYKVSVPQHLDNIRNYLQDCFIQVNDIDLTEATAEGGAFYFDGQGWLPIGDESTNFIGNYNGGRYTIIGLKSKRAGLFSHNAGTIKNLGMVGGNISGTSSGGVAGNNNGIISNCYNTSTISGIASIGGTNAYGGGITGCNEIDGIISNCYNTGTISGSISGGIIGYNYHGTISNCYNTGNILGIASGAGTNSYSGGITGYSYGSGTISNCYNLGDITVSGTESVSAGGLVGSASGTISFGYSMGEVSSTAANAFVGKVIGNNRNAALSRLYYIGTSADLGIGNEGNRSGAVECRTEEQLKTSSSLTGFDFDIVWDVSPNLNDGFPYLRSNLPNTKNKAALPKANPSGGAVASGTKVTLTTATEGATIYFTTDGSEPTTASIVYNTPIVITEDTTIKAKAYMEDMTESDTATFEYTIRQAGDIEIAVTSIGYTVTNKGGAQSGRVIMAIYDDLGKLIHTQQNEIVTINTGTNDGVFTGVQIPTEMINKYTVKLFLWTADGTMIPLAEVPAELYF